MQTTLPTDLYVAGNVACKSLTLTAGCVVDASVQQNAGIQASKLQHQHQRIFSQDSTASAVSERKTVHVTYGASATVIAFEAGAIAPATGNDTVTVDLWQNGVSILNSPITLNNSQSARQLVTSSLKSESSVAGDVFEVNVTYTHNTGTAPQGVFACLVMQESAQ